VTKLCSSCFRDCVSLLSVTFQPDSELSCIEGHAFAGCSALSSISIPASVVDISRFCFEGCASHLKVTFEPGSQLPPSLDFVINKKKIELLKMTISWPG
jgi:hypothetical protein